MGRVPHGRTVVARAGQPTPCPSLSGRGDRWWLVEFGRVLPRLLFPRLRKGTVESPSSRPRSLLRPSLEGRGWGWVGFRMVEPLWLKLAYPPPAPPFQGGGTVGGWASLATFFRDCCSPAFAGEQQNRQAVDRDLCCAPPWKGGVGGGSGSAWSNQLWLELAYPPPAPPFQGGGTVGGWVGLGAFFSESCSPASAGESDHQIRTRCSGVRYSFCPGVGLYAAYQGSRLRTTHVRCCDGECGSVSKRLRRLASR